MSEKPSLKDVWLTRDGQQIEIKKMASSHLLATIHFIERNRFNQILEVSANIYDAGDAKFWEDEAFQYYTKWPVQYESLIAEAQRRHLIYRAQTGLVKSRKK